MPSRGIAVLSKVGRILPEIKKPERKVPFREKLLWTGLVLITFLVMCEIPLYGINISEGTDPFRMLRVIFASRRGSLMELGIGPIVTGGLVLQLLVGSKMIPLDFSKAEDRAAFTAMNKLFAIIFTVFESVVYLLGGAFGQVTATGFSLILAQLIVVGILVILMDELIQKGWGLGSGISLFIAAGVAQQVAWMSISPILGTDGHFYGIFPALPGLMASGGLTLALFRPGNNPSLIGLLATFIVFLVVIYCEGLRVEIPIAHAQYRGYKGIYPVKLFYVSNIPVILTSALFADIYFGAQILYTRLQTGFLVDILGKFDAQGNPVSGLAYFVTSPRSLEAVAADPIRAVVYTAVMVLICAGFAVTWVQIGGLGAEKVAKQLIDARMQVPGFRRSEKSIEELLNRYIPVVTVLGGSIVGFIAAVADFTNTFGTGTGMLLTTSIMWQYYQILMRERLEEMYPGIARLLGKG
ncbi:MAG: preprotein translocase subunit SecY [Candidatus Bathyarchaeia archaeon]